MTFLILTGGGAVPIGLLYWLLVILWLIFGWPIAPAEGWTWRPIGRSVLILGLFILIGLKLFGFPISGS